MKKLLDALSQLHDETNQALSEVEACKTAAEKLANEFSFLKLAETGNDIRVSLQPDGSLYVGAVNGSSLEIELEELDKLIEALLQFKSLAEAYKG